MTEINVEADYVNHQFHVWADGELVKTGLSVEIQKALMKRVIADCTATFRRALDSSQPDTPPGLETSIDQHWGDPCR